MRDTTAGATGRVIRDVRWPAGRERDGRCACPRSAWSFSKAAVQPTSRPSASGPTSSVCRPMCRHPKRRWPWPFVVGRVAPSCACCGRHLLSSATFPNAGRLRYSYRSGTHLDYGEPICQSLSGQRLDALVSAAQVLSVLQPAALELHLSAAADVAQERAAFAPALAATTRNPARYEASVRPASIGAVEPENRLVVSNWNAAGRRL